MSTATVTQDFESPRKEISRAPLFVPSASPSKSLHPLVVLKYRNTSAKRLSFDFIEQFLGVDIVGFQSACGTGLPDQIMFNDPVYRTTLCVPVFVMLEPMERAREIIRQRVQEKHKAFEAAHSEIRK